MCLFCYLSQPQDVLIDVLYIISHNKKKDLVQTIFLYRDEPFYIILPVHRL